MHICVIGAGVIGVTSAYFLARQGHEVTLIEARPGPAEVSSHANGGQLSYSYVAPLAGPAVLPSVPGWLLRGDSPLRWRPRLDPRQWRWCIEFALACNARTSQASTAQLQALSYLSRDVLHALLEQEPFEFAHVRNGKLIAYRDAALLEKARALVAYQATLGAEQRVLDAAQTVELEPALAGLGTSLAGAVYTPSEEAGDCRLFTEGLFDRLQRLPNTRCLMSTHVQGLEREVGGRIRAVRTEEAGAIAADAVVLAAGVATRELLRSLGGDAPIYPLKGYSLSVPVAPDDPTAPAISVTDYQRRIVYARLGGILRIAAMVDIDGEPGIVPARVELLKRQVRESFPTLDLAHAEVWAGERPATPKGMPLIGRSKVADNLWINAGQGALGFTLACGSAALLTAQVSSLPLPIDARAFLPC
jgi:D-amino-acid dehydrogenase